MQNQTPIDFPEQPESDAAQAPNTPVTVTTPDLILAREAKRLSVGDAAYALKVHTRVIEALEAGRWSDLPGRAFAVGILRAYGRLLDVSVDGLVETIPGAAPVTKRGSLSTASPSKPAAPRSRRDRESQRQANRTLKFGAVMVLLAVVLAYAVPSQLWEDATAAAQSMIGRLLGRADPAVAENSEQPPLPTSTESVATTTSGAAEQQAATGTGTLELRFSAPAWVEVRDHTGRIIYSQLNAAGSTQFITGAAPLDVMVGNAKQVQARWRDEPVKLDKLSGDDVARQILR